MAARRNGATLYDVRDLDLMLLIADEAEGIESRELAESIGLGEEGARAAGIRLSWMRRYGIVDFDHEHKTWTLTRGGERVAEARLRAAAARTVDALPDEQLIDVMAHVTSRYRLGSPLVATMLRREFAFGTHANGQRR